MEPMRRDKAPSAATHALDLDGMLRAELLKAEGVAGTEDDALIRHSGEQ